MGMQPFLSYLERNFPGKYQLNAPMARHTSFRVGGPADVLITPDTIDGLPELLKAIQAEALPLVVMGNGSNLLVRDKGIRGVVIKLGNSLRELSRVDSSNTIRCQAGVSLSTLAARAAEYGLSGLEFAIGIPGSLGGAVVMNAGAYGGEIGELVTSATVIDAAGNLKTLSHEELAFSYRHTALQDSGDMLLEAELALKPGNTPEICAAMDTFTQKRLTKQPLNFPSAGSTFKRPLGHFAAALIDQAGLRGYRVGDAQVSEKHTGFVINCGHATASEILELMAQIREKVFAVSGVWLEPEVRILGEE